LWYNYTFFKSIFDFFSIDVVENQHYITKWVEDVIKTGVKDVESSKYQSNHEVEDAIQNGVNETLNTEYMPKVMVEDTIQNGVKETNGTLRRTLLGVDDIIQNGVKQVEPLPAQDGNRDWGNYYHGKEDRTKPFNEYLDEAIRFGVKETHDDVYHHKGRIDGIIKGGKIII
jgi:hypothetical protein